ncbi:MAG: c-type cytochrome [Planctomycetota bacterium]|jgi:YVTN family beta-propeller protein
MNRILIKWFVGTAFILFVLASAILADVGDYYSPTALVVDNAEDYIYIAEHTANQIEEFSVASTSLNRTFTLLDSPTGVAISDDDTELYVTAGSSDGKVYVISLTGWTITHTIDVGHTPMSPVVNSDSTILYVCNRFDNTVSVVSLSTYSETTTASVPREPVSMAITPSSDKLVVANHLPDGPANTGTTGCDISIINTSGYGVTNIELTNGSTGARGVCVSPDGSYAYITHILGRYQVPTSQLERGWIMTNAFSIIDINDAVLVNTVLLDDVEMGAANPWGAVCTTDGSYLCISHAGSNELSVINRTGIHSRLTSLSLFPYAGGFSKTSADVPQDLGFLSGLRDRFQLPGKGTRNLVLIGNQAYITEYFSDSISVVDISSEDTNQIPLGPQNPMTQERKGEFYFYDANETFQKWLSCTSCHPDVRSDSLNWDLANDGYGSPRQVKSLLYSHYTPPTTITGCRPDAFASVRAGFKFVEFAIRPEEDANAVDAFLMSLEPVPSPYLVNGQLSTSAQNGKTIFEARCASCHSGEYFTDMLQYDVGTGRASDPNLDTPLLSEVWRTAPYLQDGRAATMMDVLNTYNTGHFDSSGLSPGDLDNLAEYVLSLPEPPVPCYPGDFDADCDVDEDDLNRLTQAWLCQTHDVNWDEVCDIAEPTGIINFKDYSLLAQDWYKP